MSETLSRHWKSLVGRGVVAILFGIVVLVWPAITVGALVLLFGTYAIVEGVLALSAATSSDAPHRGWLVFGGLAGIAAGIVTFVWPGITALGLAVVIATWFMVTGVAEIAAAIGAPSGTAGRGLLGLTGVASVAFGIYFAVYPGSGALALVWTMGLFAIAGGIALIVAGFRFRSGVKELSEPVERVLVAAGYGS
ncbi:MAG TPA: HdeD family acid-resistance protein [Acidimicrobiales bacterium]